MESLSSLNYDNKILLNELEAAMEDKKKTEELNIELSDQLKKTKNQLSKAKKRAKQNEDMVDSDGKLMIKRRSTGSIPNFGPISPLDKKGKDKKKVEALMFSSSTIQNKAIVKKKKKKRFSFTKRTKKSPRWTIPYPPPT